MFTQSALKMLVVLISVVAGSAAASAQNYGLGGDFTFKTPAWTPPPPLTMPPNPLGAVAPPTLPMHDLKPVSPPSAPPIQYSPAIPPRTLPYVGTPTTNDPREVQIGVQHQVNPTTQLKMGVDVAPHLPPDPSLSTLNGGGVQVQKTYP